jgi:magnesium chelatase family protein
MAAIGAIPPDALDGFTVIGELALDGTISAVAGVLPAAIAANAAGKGLICPAPCGPEAAWASADLEILAPRSLIQLANHFKGAQVLSRPEPALRALGGPQPDLRDIKGQESAKRALEVAAAGGHNLLLWGTMDLAGSLARCLPSLLPPMSPLEALDVAKVYSMAGLGGCVSDRRPFRSPAPKDDLLREAKLAKHGVLFLDGLERFSDAALGGLAGVPKWFQVVATAEAPPATNVPLRFDDVVHLEKITPASPEKGQARVSV